MSHIPVTTQNVFTMHATAKHLVPSLLDRLIDDHARSPAAKMRPTLAMETVRRSIIEDVQNLLNTRPRCVAWPEHLEELNSSLLNYGVSEFAGQSLATGVDREHLRQEIADTLARFEPRLSDVRVELLDTDDLLAREVRFRVVAETGDAPDFIVFEVHAELTDALLQFHACAVQP